LKNEPNFELARQYALDRLEKELPDNLHYHSVVHTRDEVVPAAERLAAMEAVSREDLLLILTAAYFHDLGFIQQARGHEATGAGIAAQVLPDFGYNPLQVQAIASMIMATKLPQSPQNLAEMILADADLDQLGAPEFLARNRDLHLERLSMGDNTSEELWYEGQLNFLRNHSYWTHSAHALRDAGKQQNIEELARMLALA
jgi:uncharacterized protein